MKKDIELIKEYRKGYIDGLKSIVKKNIKDYLRLIHLSGEVDSIVIKEIIKLIKNHE